MTEPREPRTAAGRHGLSVWLDSAINLADEEGSTIVTVHADMLRLVRAAIRAEGLDVDLQDAIVGVIGTQYSNTGPPTEATHRARADAVARLAAEYARYARLATEPKP